MARWDWQAPTEVLTGIGARRRAARALAGQSKRVLIVSGSDACRDGLVQRWCSSLVDAGLRTVPFPLDRAGLPEVLRLTEAARFAEADTLLAIGDDRVIDVVKAAAFAATNPGFRGCHRPLRTVAVPTTVGTASEVSPVTVLADGDRRLVLDKPAFRPALAVLDPESTATASTRSVLYGAVEALARLLVPAMSEPAGSRMADEITVALARCVLADADTVAARLPEDMRVPAIHRLAVSSAATVTNWASYGRCDGQHRLWRLATPIAAVLDIPASAVLTTLLADWVSTKDNPIGPWPGRVSEVLGMLSGGSAVLDPGEWVRQRLAAWTLPDRLSYLTEGDPGACDLADLVWADAAPGFPGACREDLAAFFETTVTPG
ncbi:Alcohol dehydrogenase, class IV [Amycolatopsis xylanica]|uniref:Alcohol dehydrogenase, class IV n=1 Tax=Amycolatopsis xylanica TaxID=589385 RepID=A0A1H3P6G7_9PSEU|nr:iron-containing alcohol dehydrogenase [Amycolatopsis xylanica]SDY96716.1 Alcohol dehydrogenase, class IV [Amycolatopsis xylanica]